MKLHSIKIKNRLTHYLKEILQGNSSIKIVGTINQEDRHLLETLNTLNFISKAKKIRINPKMNFKTCNDTAKDLKIQELMSSLRHLEAENRILEEENQSLRKRVEIEKQKENQPDWNQKSEEVKLQHAFEKQEIESQHKKILSELEAAHLQVRSRLQTKIKNLERAVRETRESWGTEVKALQEELEGLRGLGAECESEVWESDLDKTVVVKKLPKSEKKRMGALQVKGRGSNGSGKRGEVDGGRVLVGYKEISSRGNSGRANSCRVSGNYCRDFKGNEHLKSNIGREGRAFKIKPDTFKIEENFDYLVGLNKKFRKAENRRLKEKRSVSRKRQIDDNFSRRVRSFSRKTKSNRKKSKF